MSTQWKPGDVALSDFCGEQDVRVVRYHSGWARLTDTDDYIPDEPILGTHRVENPRPLVVIDPEDSEQVERLWSAWRDLAPDHRLAQDNLQAALRVFANPKPPKPDEPLGLGAVVEDDRGRKWSLLPPHVKYQRWACWDEPINDRDYDSINVVRVLFRGVPS